MSVIGKVTETIGDHAPRLKNLHNVVWSKIAHNNLSGKLKHMFRGWKAAIVDAGHTVVHKFQDIGLHFKRLNKRDVRLLDIASHGQKLTPEEAKRMVDRGDAITTKATVKAWLDFMHQNKEIFEEMVAQADQRIEDEKAGRYQGIMERKAATAKANLAYLSREMDYPDQNPNFTKDTDMHMFMHGEKSAGVRGLAHYFKQGLKLEVKEGTRATESIRDRVLTSALKQSRAELEARYQTLKESIQARRDLAESGDIALGGARLLQIEAAATAQAIDYANLCLENKEERAELMGAYHHALGIHSSVRPALGGKPQVRRNELRDLRPDVPDTGENP